VAQVHYDLGFFTWAKLRLTRSTWPSNGRRSLPSTLIPR